MGEYAVTKSGLGAIVRCVAVEYGPHAIRCNLILPGLIRTDATAETPPALVEKIKTRSPIARHGEPEDLAGLVVYLMSDAAKFHTGDFITIDGGWSVGI